jgi:uroporphyrinogen-III synthase
MQKHKEEKYLLSLSDVHKPENPKSLDKAKIKYTKAIFYKTVSSDLSDLRDDFPMK